MVDNTLHTIGLWDAFQSQTASLSNRPAISSQAGERTFANLFDSGDKLAGALLRAGVQEGNIVALALPNSLAFVPAFLALLKLSAVTALVSPKYRESELEGINQGVKPQYFLTTPALARIFVDKLEIRATSTISISELGEDMELLFPSPADASGLTPSPADTDAFSKENIALIKFTSGSTGVLKGIALTANNILAEARNVATTLALSPKDRILAPVPLFHSYGFDLGVLSMLFSGAHLGIHDGFIPRRMLQELCQPDVTVFLGVPSMYQIFVETLLSDTPDLSHVRYLLSCTAPLRPDLITAFHKKFQMPICQHYGSSETGAVTNHMPWAVLDRMDSVGRPLNNVQVQIQDSSGQPMPVGTEGEVVVKSQVVAPGYIMGEQPGESKFKDGTYRTGDLGIVDKDGFLRLTGRRDGVINVGGFKVSPYEVTQVLEHFPAVREAAVIGVKDSLGEDVVYAAVTLISPATENDILAFCRSRLSDYKVPRGIRIMDEMPRGPSGKIKLTQRDVGL